MAKYGAVALRAVELLRHDPNHSPADAWRKAATETFSNSPASRVKGCPKAAFLGLCEDGLVAGVPARPCGAGTDNKAYAVEAVRILVRNPSIAAEGAAPLWRRVMNGREKAPNKQMDVVLALWDAGLIKRTK